jgi:hypothetical protein
VVARTPPSRIPDWVLASRPLDFYQINWPGLLSHLPPVTEMGDPQQEHNKNMIACKGFFSSMRFLSTATGGWRLAAGRVATDAIRISFFMFLRKYRNK